MTSTVDNVIDMLPYDRGNGAKWIASSLSSAAKSRSKRRRPAASGVSEFGARVADLLGEIFGGIYHLEWSALARAQWDSDHYIRVTTFQEFATYDYDYLTRFVVLCHDYCVRGVIGSAGPRLTAMEFSRRTGREGSFAERHPTIEDAIARIRGQR